MPADKTRTTRTTRDRPHKPHRSNLEHALLGGLSQPLPSEEHHRRFGVDKVIFGVTAALSLAFVLWGFLWTTSLGTTSTDALGWVMSNAGWAFVLMASLFVVFVLWLAASRYGNIPLGADSEKPEFSGISWVAMMFSVGMGIGLMFYGVAEPLFHYASPPPGPWTARRPRR